MDCCLEVLGARCQATFKFVVDGMWFTADAYKPLTMHPRNCRSKAYLSFLSPALVIAVILWVPLGTLWPWTSFTFALPVDIFFGYFCPNKLFTGILTLTWWFLMCWGPGGKTWQRGKVIIRSSQGTEASPSSWISLVSTFFKTKHIYQRGRYLPSCF